MLTFPATGHHHSLTDTKWHCLVTEAHVCVNNLPRIIT